MKLIVDKHFIETKKDVQVNKIVSFADIHLNPSLNKKMFKMLLNFLVNDPPEIITIPGDIMNAKYYSDRRCLDKLEYLLTSLSEFSNVFISLGNHDIYKMNSNERSNFDKLNRIKNVYALDNAQVKIKNLNILGFSPTHKAYEVEEKLGNKIFIEQFRKSNFNVSNQNFNILLNHNPLQIVDLNVQECLDNIFKYIDIIISGHLHNGYLPDEIEENFKNIIKDYGIRETPELFPKKIISKVHYCRGMHDFKNGKLIINKGFRSYAGYIPSFIPTNPHLDEIYIKKL